MKAEVHYMNFLPMDISCTVYKYMNLHGRKGAEYKKIFRIKSLDTITLPRVLPILVLPNI